MLLHRINIGKANKNIEKLLRALKYYGIILNVLGQLISLSIYVEKYPSLVEGTGLENREVGNGAGVRIPLSPPLISRNGAAW